MRHRAFGKNLSRTSAHRLAMRRNMVRSLFEHGTISTTREKAKYVKPLAEKLITLAKDGTLAARRRAIAMMPDRDICKVENGEPVKVDTVIRKLFSEIGPRFAKRSGGYTRIIKLPLRRVGDNGQLVLLQLVDEKISTRTRRSKPTGESSKAEIAGQDSSEAGKMDESSPDAPSESR
jgi:large subunit ribosomal protein L17